MSRTLGRTKATNASDLPQAFLRRWLTMGGGGFHPGLHDYKRNQTSKNLSLSPYSVEKKGRYNYAAKVHDSLIVRPIFYNQHKVSLVRN